MNIDINPNAYKEEEWELIGPDGNFVGIIDNIFTLMDFQLQIKHAKIQGYSLHSREGVITIDKNGRLGSGPEIFPKFREMLFELILP
jgi:hypothetical protein